MPRGHEYDPIYRKSSIKPPGGLIREGGLNRGFTVLVQYLRALFGQILLQVFRGKDCNGKKKIVVPCLDVTMLAFFREKYIAVLFLPEKRA